MGEGLALDVGPRLGVFNLSLLRSWRPRLTLSVVGTSVIWTKRFHSIPQPRLSSSDTSFHILNVLSPNAFVTEPNNIN